MIECTMTISNRAINAEITGPIEVSMLRGVCVYPDTPRLLLQDALEEKIMRQCGGDWVLVAWGTDNENLFRAECD